MKKMVVFQIILFSLLFVLLLFMILGNNSNLLPSTKVTLENTTILENSVLLLKSVV